VGRTGASTPEAQATVAELTKDGVEVVVRKLDVTREQQVEGLLSEIRATLPPLRGVIHSVLVMDDGILLHQTDERFHKVVDPKVLGAWNLHRHTQDAPLDFFVCFSSLTSMLGMGGQGSYAAGNLFLDILASLRRGQGLPALTINWGPLADVGWLARHAAVNERVLRQGARAMSSTQALDVLGRLLTTERHQVGVVDIDWRQWHKLSLSGLASPRLAHLLESQKNPAVPGASLDLLEVVRSADEKSRREIVVAYLCELVAGVLGTTAAKVDVQRTLPDLGVDSLMAVELQVRLRQTTGLVVPVMNLLRRQTVSELAGLLEEHLNTKTRTT
jgi:acyl carrier protein